MYDTIVQGATARLQDLQSLLQKGQVKPPITILQAMNCLTGFPVLLVALVPEEHIIFKAYTTFITE